MRRDQVIYVTTQKLSLPPIYVLYLNNVLFFIYFILTCMFQQGQIHDHKSRIGVSARLSELWSDGQAKLVIESRLKTRTWEESPWRPRARPFPRFLRLPCGELPAFVCQDIPCTGSIEGRRHRKMQPRTGQFPSTGTHNVLFFRN